MPFDVLLWPWSWSAPTVEVAELLPLLPYGMMEATISCLGNQQVGDVLVKTREDFITMALPNHPWAYGSISFLTVIRFVAKDEESWAVYGHLLGLLEQGHAHPTMAYPFRRRVRLSDGREKWIRSAKRIKWSVDAMLGAAINDPNEIVTELPDGAFTIEHAPPAQLESEAIAVDRIL